MLYTFTAEHSVLSGIMEPNVVCNSIKYILITKY